MGSPPAWLGLQRLEPAGSLRRHDGKHQSVQPDQYQQRLDPALEADNVRRQTAYNNTPAETRVGAANRGYGTAATTRPAGAQAGGNAFASYSRGSTTQK